MDNFQIKVQAVSSKKEIRGIRFRQHRPTKVLLDDWEHSQEVESEELREKYERTFREVFCKIGNKETNMEVIGTILHKKSLLSNIIKRLDFDSTIYPAILDWSERSDLWQKSVSYTHLTLPTILLV